VTHDFRQNFAVPRVRLDDGATVPARTVIIATGARYRKPALDKIAEFEGAGVYYSATFMEEAQPGDDDEVVVVGGANSAGQAAVFLAQTGRLVQERTCRRTISQPPNGRSSASRICSKHHIRACSL
jgi:thioredoxin reductase